MVGPLSVSYTHLKHDGFIEFGEGTEVIERFSGKLLIQQEPDASSFPKGGIRNTLEERGYTAWDVSSPAFVVDLSLIHIYKVKEEIQEFQAEVAHMDKEKAEAEFGDVDVYKRQGVRHPCTSAIFSDSPSGRMGQYSSKIGRASCRERV